MTTRDQAQKLEMRAAFWAMGASTRLEVKLGALVSRTAGRADRQEWTDLDVLAIHYIPMTGLSFTVADCKTSRGRVAERLFWLRGVMDLFGAHAGYLVRDEALPPASRQLALRLGVSAMDRADREALLQQVGISRPQAGSFFDGSAHEARTRLLASLPSDFDRMRRYRETGYWLAPSHRNLTGLPGQLSAVSDKLNPRSRTTMALTTDLAWLYLLAMIRAVDEMARLQLADLDVGLAQVVIGDERERREKTFLAEQLQRLFEQLPARGQRIPTVDLVPPYYADLADLAYRVSRRRAHALEALRVLEFVGVETIAAGGQKLADLPEPPSPFAVKLASDVIRFLRRASGLSEEIVSTFDRLTTTHETESRETTSEGRAQPDSGLSQTRLFDEQKQPAERGPHQ